MARSTNSELNRYLKSLEKQELETEVKKLFSKIPAVKQYYEQELTGDSGAVLEKYKAKIRKEYFRGRGFGNASSSASRKAVQDFKKISVFPRDVVELWLYRTEMMLDYTLAWGDLNESFYNSLCMSFEEACCMICKEGLESEFQDYCTRILAKASEAGWGVYDSMQFSYANIAED
ncbi:hypothetical protein D770_00055 [Flammeovirgaceae bacterium 311]|nr:hypothetical protein D770_00055 [Flammeovirgaceae bacterium 311]